MSVRALRIICLLLILVAVPRLASTWVGQSSEADEVSLHADGTPCHDGMDADAPCDDGCACVCCATLRAFTTPIEPIAGVVFGVPSLITIPEPPSLHPVEPYSRLYRPPRS